MPLKPGDKAPDFTLLDQHNECILCEPVGPPGRRPTGTPRSARPAPRTSGPGFGLTTHEDVLDVPFRWRQPRLVFVNSMSDLFHEDVPEDFIRSVFEVMRDTPRHTYQAGSC